MSPADKDASTLVEDPSPATEQSGETRRKSSPEPSPNARVLDFGARYRVLEAIGRGGMGEVYRAYDATLLREVALKIVRADRADHDLAFERFRREIALASKVTHENVLRVYDLSEKGDLRFLSMQFVEGQDLCALMKSEGRLPLPRALALFRQACEGLSAAHKQGIVHRDLKPQNVLVDRADHVYVADFGLARSLEDPTMTAEGALLGSPAYMSPEQVKGDPLGARSDIYSLGVMLYQLLAGETPFQGSSAHSVMEQRLHRKPVPVRQRNAEVPAKLERIVQRCLEVEPARRYASVAELLADLDAPDGGGRAFPRHAAKIAGVVSVLLALVGGAAWLHRSSQRAPSPATAEGPAATSASLAPGANGAVVRVLVLLVENRTADPVLDGTLEYVLGTALRRSTAMIVYAESQERDLAAELGAARPDEELGQKLLARDRGRVVTVRAAVAPSGAGYTLSLSAKDAKTGAVLVSRMIEAADPSRVVPALGSLAWALRAGLGEVAPTDARLAEQTGASLSLEADHEAAVGRALVGIGKNAEAIVHLERAVALDPEFAAAHARLAITLWNEGRQTEAAAHFKLGLKWGDGMGEYDRRTLLADYYAITGEYDKTIAELEQMLRMWPGDVSFTIDLCDTYLRSGVVDQALAVCGKCAADHPRDVISRSNALNATLLADRLEDARVGSQQFVREFPHPLWTSYLYLGLSDLLLRRRQEATDAFEKLREASPSIAAAALADLAFYEGRLSDASSLLEAGIAGDVAAKNADAAALKWSIVAQLRLRRGDKAGAIAAADKAAASSVPATVYAAGQTYIDGQKPRKAEALAGLLAESLSADARRFARLLSAELLRASGKPREAVDVYEDALRKTDSWLVHFLLGRTYLDLGAFADARSELTKCLAHRGQGALAFLDDRPTLRYLPPAYHLLARAQEGLGSPEAADAYRSLLALLPDEQNDPLADIARKKLSRP